MNKSDEKLNIPKDISIFEYVAGHQSEGAKAQFEKALDNNHELREEVALEEQFRSLVKQSEPSSPISSDNIHGLFDKIDADSESINNTEKNDNNANVILFKKPAAGFAIAASLFVAIFLSVNVSNNNSQNTDDMLNPNFNVLTSIQNESIDVNSLAEQQRLIKFVLADSLSTDELQTLMNEHQLQLLSQSLDKSVITAKASVLVDEKKLATLIKDLRIEEVELIKFN